MNKYRHGELCMGLLIALLVGFSGPVIAQSNGNQVSYSPDHWPSRWSSAIRQQQTAKFPTRDTAQTSPAELPEGVFEQDLFFSPSMANRFDRGDGRLHSGKRNSPHRFSRNSGQYIRDPAFAYQAGYGATYQNYGGSAYMYPSTASMPGFDPVPGYPGAGIPLMPGVPGAYPMNVNSIGGLPYGGFPPGGMPFGGMPFGGAPLAYPGSMGMWNPPFAPW